MTPDERRQTRASGGKNRAAITRLAKNMPEQFRRCYEILMNSIEEVAAGTGEPGRLTAISTGVRAIVALVEVADMSARMEAMEATLLEIQKHDERNA